MTTIAIWYLIVRSSGSDNAIAVPQASREQCIANVKWLIDTGSVVKSSAGNAYCVPGVAVKP